MNDVSLESDILFFGTIGPAIVTDSFAAISASTFTTDWGKQKYILNDDLVHYA